MEQGPAVAERGPVAAPAREVEVVRALGEEPQAAEESVSRVQAGELALGAE